MDLTQLQVERDVIDVLARHELTSGDALKVLESVRKWVEERSLVRKSQPID